MATFLMLTRSRGAIGRVRATSGALSAAGRRSDGPDGRADGFPLFSDGGVGARHSRAQTALGMFSHVRDALEAGEVVLDKADLTGPGDDRPLVKDKYGSERRKAKTLNFSIAYGKTAHGLAKDWGVAPAKNREKKYSNILSFSFKFIDNCYFFLFLSIKR